MSEHTTQRDLLKQESRSRILDAAAARLRNDGLGGAPIAPVMKDAGLTHGAFYSHFSNKDELAVAAFRHAITESRGQWTGPIKDRSWKSRVVRLARGYLNRKHRDQRYDSCPFSALATDAARASEAFRLTFEKELHKSLNAMGGRPLDDQQEHPHYDEAIALMAIFVGGLSLSRAVGNVTFSDRILKICRNAAEQISATKNQNPG